MRKAKDKIIIYVNLCGHKRKTFPVPYCMQYLFVVICILFFSESAICQQNFDSSRCNRIYNGYIMRIFQKGEKFRLLTADFFYSDKLPKIEDNIDFDQMLNDCVFLNERYYENTNSNIVYSSSLFSFYYLSDAYKKVDVNNYGNINL